MVHTQNNNDNDNLCSSKNLHPSRILSNVYQTLDIWSNE